jgi:hypothetical protein
VLLAQFPLGNAPRPASNRLPEFLVVQLRKPFRRHPGGSGQQVVGSRIESLAARKELGDLAKPGHKRVGVVKGAQIQIQAAGSRQGRIHHMGRRAVHIRRTELRQIDGVQSLRIAGAKYVFHFQTGAFRGAGDTGHEFGFAAAGSALDHPEEVPAGTVHEVLVQGVETVSGIRPQKIASFILIFHSLSLSRNLMSAAGAPGAVSCYSLCRIKIRC